MGKDEIKEILQAKATQLGFNTTNAFVRLLVNLATETVFLLQHLTTWKVLEAGFTSSTLLNSKIQHASDMFFSVFRGSLQKVTLKQVQPLKDKIVNKLDLCGEISGYFLYYASDYSFKYANDLYYDVEILVSKDAIEEEQFQSKEFLHTVKKESLDDLFLFKNGDEVEIVNQLRDQNDTTPYLGVTAPNYYINLWNYGGFSASDLYTVKYFPYPVAEENMDTSLIKSLPDFKGSTIKAETRKEFTPRETDQDKIVQQSLISYRSNQIITTQTDLVEYIKLFFTEFNEVIIVAGIKNINIIYTTPTGDVVTTARIDEFLLSVEKAFYIDQTFTFEYAKMLDPAIELSLTITYTSQFDFNLVNVRIRDIQTKIGKEFDPLRLVNQITHEIKEIYSIQVNSSQEIVKIPYDTVIQFIDGGVVEYVPYIPDI